MSKTTKDKAQDPVVPLLKSIGLSEAKAKLDDKQAGLIVALGGALVKSDKIAEEGRAYVVSKIVGGQLKTVDQVTGNVAAVKYVEGHPTPIDDADFDKNWWCSITATELYEHIAKYTTDAAIAGWSSLGQVISGVKNIPELRWANTLEEPKKPAAAAKTQATSTDDNAARKSVFEEGFLGALHKPGENPQIRPEFREQHLAFTGGKVFTRFPPEPNGYLHIGHSKAIFVSFGYAAHHGGKCYLRYDDTNPEKEEAQYFESILVMVRWLGFEPWKITYSSDYFQQLYELAVELIKRDKAYVCHCTQEEIKAARGEKSGALPKACVHRTRPISESLAEFQKMKDGFYRPKEANLRMKMDLEDGNPQMWDLTAYRVLETPHHRTHDKWKIYPTYDYTHCLVDSFENISHSLCTTEFVASRQSYEWLCDALEVYKPRQSEFGRLNLEGTIMSKRKILALVQKGYVNGWDDPRLYTLIALRRRGVPPGAITSFVSTLGVSTSTSSIELARFEQSVRHYLEGTAPRLLMVLRPLKVTIENLPEDYLLMVDKPLHPKIAALGTTTIPFTRTIYIDADDFRLEDSKDYFRLAPGKTVGLFQAPHPITCTSHKTDASGQVVELICRLEDGAGVKKPKAYIQWVAEHAPSGSPVRVDETRIFHQLFKSDQPSADFLDDVDPNSLEVIRGAMVETGFWSLAKRALTEARRESKERTDKALKDSAKDESSPDDDTPRVTSEQLVGNECIRFQGLRVAYFAVDKDSRLACLDEAAGVAPARKQGDHLVLNRIVSLKEDSGKAA
ncbi:glutamine-tRNA ligase [Mycena olivaceomarginata]|nr:glutamine-tRNA ligase [Mycena olivaceomarginata]